jgi:hypothetical protein
MRVYNLNNPQILYRYWGFCLVFSLSDISTQAVIVQRQLMAIQIIQQLKGLRAGTSWSRNSVTEGSVAVGGNGLL